MERAARVESDERWMVAGLGMAERRSVGRMIEAIVGG